MRVHANRVNIVGFSDVGDIQPSIDIPLLEGETGVSEYPLRGATFASINSLSLLFVSVPKLPPPSDTLQRVILWAKKTLGYATSVSNVKPERYGRRAAASWVPAATAADAPLVDRLREKGAAPQPTAK